MGDITTILPTYFGLKTRATKERGNFICKAAAIKISKTFENFAVIRTRHVLLDKLEAAGFPFVDKIMQSTLGTPYVQLGRETYVASRHIAGTELDLDCEKSVMAAVENIAKFHALAKGMGDAGLETAPSLTEIFAKNAVFLTKTLRQLNKTSRLSDFDVMILKNIGQYINYATKSIELLQETGYDEMFCAAVEGGHICHNALKEENLPIHNDICHITNWNEATVGVQITDIAGFLHRYARRSECKVSLFKLIAVYSDIVQLPTNAVQIIYAYLIHPWQFVKIAGQYYSKKRGWTPGAITSRMANLLEQQEKYDAFVNTLA